jgi:Flp pilus assembly protein TadG
MNQAPRVRRPPVSVRAGATMSNGEEQQKRRAQSLVEFALIVPVLFVLTMGIMEFGWLFRNYMTVHYSTREAARAGAVAGDLGGADLEYILRAISTSMETMPYDDLLQVKIYKADPSCEPNCPANVYTRDRQPYPASWHQMANGWPSDSRQTQEPTDALGVQIQFRHRFLVNLIPGAIGTTIIDDHSVVQIEPAYFATPGPGGP